ncbi:MAG: hypothetical protein MJY82_10520 [Fibrobacter sp.]|nr:hypothetical protein [Fibrobacter sp.]
MKGFAPNRTVRFIAALIALVGMFCLFIERVLSVVLNMAQGAVQMAVERYSNFTGRMALENFAEDRKLFALVKEAEERLPSADIALTILMVLSIVLIIVAAIGFAFPRQFAHVLVAFKLLKWQQSDFENEDENTLSSPSKKVIIITSVVVLFLLILCLSIRYCSESAAIALQESASQELSENALTYINAQKNYFSQKKSIGGPKALQLPDSTSTDNFTFKVTGSRFVAISKIPFGDCPAGTKWSVNSGTKGFFTQELTLARVAPKDTNCVKLVPDFKYLGRNKPTNKKASK